MSPSFSPRVINGSNSSINYYYSYSKILMMKTWVVVLSVGLCIGTAHGQDTITKYYHANGKISSEGRLVDGKPEGWWVTYYDNGAVRSEGNRKSFKLDSLWRFFDEKGRLTSEISYKEDRKEGSSRRFDTTGTLLSAEQYAHDLKEGIGRYYREGGSLDKEIPYVAGKEEGLGYEYAPDGRVTALLYYKAGMLRRREDINKVDGLGMRQGPWKEFHPNGKVRSEGQYVDDRRQGIFKEYDAQGGLKEMVKYDGGVVDQKAQETLTVDIKRTFHPNGKVASIGSYSKSGKREGLFKQFDTNGKATTATIFQGDVLMAEGGVNELGVMQGPWVEYYASGEKRAEGSYSEGKKEGDWTYYHKSGKVEQKGHFMNGLAQGEWKWYFDNGSLHREEHYRKGKEDGASSEYDEEGHVVTQGEYIDGLKEGKWIYAVGDHREEGSYKGGLKDGSWLHTYDTGKRCFIGAFVDGEPDGRQRWYWPNGRLRLEGKYALGLEQGDFTYYTEEGDVFMTIRYRDGLEMRVDGGRIPPPYQAGTEQP